MQSPDQKQKKKVIQGGGSLNQRILIFAVLVIVLIFGFTIFTSFLNRESGAELDAIQALVNKQAQLVGTASHYNDNVVRDQSIANFAITVQYGMTTSELQTIGYLKKHGRKIDARKLGTAKNAEAEAALGKAAANNTYDETLAKYINLQLADYSQALKTATDGAVSDAQKQLVQLNYNRLKPLAISSAAPANSVNPPGS